MMDFGRILRALLMVLFLIPTIYIIIFSPNALSGLIWLFVFSLLFWFLVGWLTSEKFNNLLWRISFWAEGADRKSLIDSASSPFRSYLVDGKAIRKTGKNQALLFSKEFIDRPSGIVDFLERAFFPTSLIIGVDAVYFAFLDFTGLIFVIVTNPVLLAINFTFLYVLSPALVSLIVIPIWLVNDTNARIFHARTGEIRRIGNSFKNVLNAIAGFGAIVRLGTLLLTLWILFVTLFVFFIIPFPIFLTTSVYLWGQHSKHVERMGDTLEQTR